MMLPMYGRIHYHQMVVLKENNQLTPSSFNVLCVSLLTQNFDSFSNFLEPLPPSGLAMTSPLPHDSSGLNFLALRVMLPMYRKGKPQ